MAEAATSLSGPPTTAQTPPPAPRAHARITSQTPGRLRVRVGHPGRHRELMHAIRQRLEEQRGTQDVSVDTRTGSVLVKYDPHTQSHGNLLSVLHDLGVVAAETARGLDLDVPEIGTGHSAASENIVGTFADLDRQIALLTGHKVDLKLLFPLALGGIGAWQLARRGLGLGEVPAYVLLWYAFDSFWKFHRSPPAPQTDPVPSDQPS
jgi:hypothetical protein